VGPGLGHNSLALEGDALGCSVLLQQPPKMGEKSWKKLRGEIVKALLRKKDTSAVL